MPLIDFTLSNARRFYTSMGNPTGLKGLNALIARRETIDFTLGGGPFGSQWAKLTHKEDN